MYNIVSKPMCYKVMIMYQYHITPEVKEGIRREIISYWNGDIKKSELREYLTRWLPFVFSNKGYIVDAINIVDYYKGVQDAMETEPIFDEPILDCIEDIIDLPNDR